MSGRGKKSDKEQPGPSGTSVRTKITTTVTKKEETYYDNSLKPETKGDKVKPSTKSTPKKKEGPKNELESDLGAVGGDGQDKEAMSGKGKKSDGSKGATKEQPGPDGVEGIAKKFDSLSTKDGEETNGTPRTKAMADGGTTQKHKDFVSKPMGEKDVAEIPGIGEVSAVNLRKENWIKAYQIYGQYLILQKDKTKFKEFIQKFLTKGKKQDADNIYNAMKEYSEKVSKYVHEGFANDRKATTPTLAQ